MTIAHQPGSEPIKIPEQIPNPAVTPRVPKPAPIQEPRKPVKVPQRSARLLPLGLLLCAGGMRRWQIVLRGRAAETSS